MKELLVATGNLGKFKEIKEILGNKGFKIWSLKDLGIIGDAVEDGDTFEKNSYKKASYFFEKSGVLTLSEDSGIIVDALPNELGVKTKRWGAGENATDEEWIKHFLNVMKNVKNKSASFFCDACLVGDSTLEHFSGVTSGLITAGLQAPIFSGVPLSSCFVPDGYKNVYSALSVAEKNNVSHRGKAMKGVLEWILSNK